MPPVKRRYVLFEIKPLLVDTTRSESTITPTAPTPSNKRSTKSATPIFGQKISEGEIVREVREAVRRLHGDFGLGSILLNFYAKKYDPVTRTGVLVAKRESYRFVLTALPLIRSIRGYDITISVLRLSGTLRGCLRALRGYHCKKIHEYRQSLRGEISATATSANTTTTSKIAATNKRKRKRNDHDDPGNRAKTKIDSVISSIGEGFQKIADSLREK